MMIQIIQNSYCSTNTDAWANMMVPLLGDQVLTQLMMGAWEDDDGDDNDDGCMGG